MLLVGNHSGGNLTPGHRRLHARLRHLLRRRAALLPARPQPRALDAGARLPAQVRHGRRNAGERRPARSTRAPRCSSTPAATTRCTARAGTPAKVDFGGRKGFIRLALDKDVPIVPVVSVGGQETALFLSRGERLAKLLRLDKMFRLKVLPISIALPWGLNVGDMLGHFPLPAKITIQVLAADRPARALRRQARPRRGLRRHHRRRCRHTLDALQAERTPPGHRLRRRCGSSARSTIDAPARGGLGARRATRATTARFMAGITRGSRQRRRGRSPGVGSRYSMRMRVGSADVGGLVELVEYDPPRDLAWTSITGIDQRGRWRLRDAGDGCTRVTLRLSYGAPGGLLGAVADRLRRAPGRRSTSSGRSRI